MEEALTETKRMIDLQLFHGKIYINPSFNKNYQKFYFLTNENINEYMQHIDFKQKDNALTVLSSGDHAFNLIHNGINKIDTFDINSLTEYYVFGFRVATILKYDYKDFETFMNKIIGNDENIISLEEISQLLYDLLPFMEEKYRKYWKEVIDYNYRQQKGILYPANLINMLTSSNGNYNRYKLNNNYLLTKEDYNILKNNLLKSNITFKNVDLFDLSSNFNCKYDFIFLSNIIDYLYLSYGENWDYNYLQQLIDNLKNLLKEDSLLALSYVFNCELKIKRNSYLFFNSVVKYSDLVDSQVVLVPTGIRNCDTKYKDGLILVKK